MNEVSGSEPSPSLPQRKTKQPILQEDIFGNQYLGKQSVCRITFDLSCLPEEALTALSILDGLADKDDLIQLVLKDAIAEVRPEFWTAALDRHSPVEWKLLEAAKDLEFRQKLENILIAD